MHLWHGTCHLEVPLVQTAKLLPIMQKKENKTFFYFCPELLQQDTWTPIYTGIWHTPGGYTMPHRKYPNPYVPTYGTEQITYAEDTRHTPGRTLAPYTQNPFVMAFPPIL